jgi:ATP-dependent 26S proteasome regulatory subunit
MLEDALLQSGHDDLPEEIRNAAVDEIERRTKLIESEIRYMKNEIKTLKLDQEDMQQNINATLEKIKVNKQLPYLVGNVVEVGEKKNFPFSSLCALRFALCMLHSLPVLSTLPSTRLLHMRVHVHVRMLSFVQDPRYGSGNGRGRGWTRRPRRTAAWQVSGHQNHNTSGAWRALASLSTDNAQTIFLPVAGLVDESTLRPGDLIGVNKDSYLILDTLPAE